MSAPAIDIAQALVGYSYPLLGLILTIAVIVFIWYKGKKKTTITDKGFAKNVYSTPPGDRIFSTGAYPDEQEAIDDSMNKDIFDHVVVKRGQMHSSFRPRDWMMSELQPRKSLRW